MSVATDGRSASLTVPGSASRLVVERKGRNGKWSPWMTSRVKSGTITRAMRLPKSLPTDWRARAEVPISQQAANRKYPAAFYKGARAFHAVAAAGYVDSSNAPMRGLNAGVTALSSLVNDSAKSTPSSTPVEADIWKTDGTTVYFFNQLRGLQVIDLADPANPSLISSLRLPSLGQDLYILPAQEDDLHAVLLTRDSQNWSSTIVHLVRITGGKPSIVATQKVSGWLSDSRIAGNNLYLATQHWSSSGGSWSEKAILTQVTIDTAAGSLASAADFQITGSWPVISAGMGWMAVATTPSTNWNKSDVALFSFDENGLTRLNSIPIQTAGRLYDKFKMQVKDGVFTAISQGWQASDGEWAWPGTQVTQLENFSTLGEALGSLEIIRGETLYATRFAGDKAYAVTFFQTDPLWVIDLSDSANPVISGHLEVPGWSTYIEPLGDLLFAIGVDSGRVEASLFDVSDPANPTLASRIQLSQDWGYSEALYNEKALKILSEENLALIPFSSYGQAEGQTHSVQLVEWNLETKTLAKRGAIQHDFEPRRSAMVGGALASISQRQLITANISNRDTPQVLADLLLAWPVNRLAIKGDFLLEIADGSTWWDSQPAIRVATAQDPDSILEEASISGGCVMDAVVRGDRLYLAREIGMRRGFGYLPVLRVSSRPALEPVGTPALAVDVYDISNLPAIRMLGTSKIDLPGNENAWLTSRLLFPSDHLAVLVSQPQPGFIWCGVRVDIPQPVAHASNIAASSLPWWDGWWKPKVTQPSRAVAFDFANPAAPTTSALISLTEKEAVNLQNIHAAAGLVIYGFGREDGVDISEGLQSHSHRLGILDFQNPASPVLRPSIDLPGRLAAASDISREGFLVWTEAWNSTARSMELQASACDLSDVYKITTLTRPGALTILNRDIFIAGPSAIKRHSLSDSGLFQTTAELPLDWSPSRLTLTNNTLLGGDNSHVVAVPLAAFPANPIEWETDRALDLQSVVTTSTGDLLAPAGENGVDRFAR